MYVGILVGSFIFIICEPSHYCTQQFENFGDELGQCDWYALPIELQRMYLIFLSDTQKEIEIDSYGNITCQRDTSKKVFCWYYPDHIDRTDQLKSIHLSFSDYEQNVFILYDFS